MLELVLLGGRIVFLVVLYLFVFLVIRSAVKDLGRRSATVPEPGTAAPIASFAQGSPAGRTRDGVDARPAGTHGAWELVVAQSRVVPVGTAYSLPLGRAVLVGRATESDIQLRDTFVSSRHVRLEGAPDGLYVEDLGSTNGTLVNGAELERPMLLDPGDQLTIGDTVFRVDGA